MTKDQGAGWRARVLAVAVLVVGVAAIGINRWRRSDPTRSTFCRLAGCPGLDRYDRLCSEIAEAEVIEGPSRKAAIVHTRQALASESSGAAAAEVLSKALALPPPERYAHVRASARSEGSVVWECPPLDRVLTSTEAL